MSIKENMSIKEILLNIDARISHIEDITADNRAIIVKLVKQGNSIVNFLKNIEIEAAKDIEVEYEPITDLNLDLNVGTPFGEEKNKDIKGIKELIDEFMDKRKDLQELEEELKKNKDDITPNTVGEA